MPNQKKLIFLLSLIAAFIPYLFISIYSNPAPDDFTYAFKGKAYNILQTIINEYFNWNGRYTSNVLVLINPIAFKSFIFYKIIPVLIIFLTIISYLIFVKVLIGRFISRIDIYIISFLLSLLYIFQMPIISEGIYLYTGAITYQLGNICALTYISLLTLFYKRQFVFNNKKIHLIILTIFLFLTIGFNEVIMIALLCFSLIFLFIVHKNRLENKALANYLFLVTLVFSSFVYFAPGNLVRESYFPNNHDIIHSIVFSIAQSIRFFLDWISSAPLLLLSILFFYLNKNLSKNIKLFSVSFYLSPFYSSLLLLIVIFISVFPAYWATGILGQHRTLNVAYYLFVITWFINLTVWFNFYENRMKNIQSLNKNISNIILIVILGSFLFTKNGYNSITDILNGRAKSYNMQMNERYSLIKSSKDTIYFKPITDPPKSLFLYDITDNPEHWLNKCYTVYFECEDKLIMKK